MHQLPWQQTRITHEDVLMPGIAICRDCHGGQHAENLLQSTCIDCHQFHLPGQALMLRDINLDPLPGG